MFEFLKKIFNDEVATTLSVTYSFSPNTLILSSQVNQNFTDVQSVVNALTADNLADDAVTAAKLNADVIRTDYGLIQHTDGSLYVDVSDTNPCLEISDGGLRALVDDVTIERTASGLAIKDDGVDSDQLAAGGIDFEHLSSLLALDEDDMSSDSATALATQQSIKAYADSLIISSILDYGISSSSSTEKDQNDLIICYGQIVVPASGSQAITNLPFTSTTSYQVSIDASPYYGMTTEVNLLEKNSESQFTIYNGSAHELTYCWIAIGS